MRYKKGDLVRIKDGTDDLDGCQGVIDDINGEYFYITVATYDHNFQSVERYRTEFEHWYPRKPKTKLPEELFEI